MVAQRRVSPATRAALESLERRLCLAAFYVDNPADFVINTDRAPAGLSNDDVVTFNSSGGSHTTVSGLTFGTNAFGTVQSAVNAAVAGDTINVGRGTFAELVTVNKRLVLRGNQFGVDARQPSRSGPAPTAAETVLTGSGGSTSFHVTASDVILDGFTVQGQTNASPGAGVVLGAGTAGSEVRNNIVQDNVVGLLVANNSATNQTVIERNVIRNNDRPGPVSGTGIYSDQFSAGGAVTNVLIDGNSFIGNDASGGAAISLSSTSAGSQSNFTISRNLFDGNSRALLAFNFTNSSFTANHVTNSSFAGSADLRLFEGVSQFTITNNTLQGNGADVRALRVGNIGTGSAPAGNITLEFNSISGYGNAGVQVDAGGYVGTLDAEFNWWGSPTGPTITSNPGGTGQRIVDPNNQVDYLPYLTSGADADPAAIGFQPGPPRAGAQFQYEKAPHSIKYVFTDNVLDTLGPTDFVLKNLSTGVEVPTSQIALSIDPSNGTAVFTFLSGFTPSMLPDANYRGVLKGSGVTNPAGIALDGDNNGSPGGDHVFDFFFLTADRDRSRAVDFGDLVAVAQNYGLVFPPSMPTGFSGGDFNYDNRVDFGDLVILAQNYGRTLPPPPVAAANTVTVPVSVRPARAAAEGQSRSRPVFDSAQPIRPTPPASRRSPPSR